ncbi:MAG: toll/interleukin-1 receptor domain-containing protein [Sphingomicrobium sp.]
MAKLFLSYDREDGETARSLAAALEQSGHEVWWDRHILGGAEYSEEIEQALDRADTVIVLWSKASVKSAWVRDEAAAGRDSGRLVPALLEPIKPPMGFRQYQTVDLSDWTSRRRSKRFDDLNDAIASTSGPGPKPDPVPEARPRAIVRRRIPLLSKGLAIAAFLVIALGGAYWALSGKLGSRSQTVLVSAVNPQSRGLANNLMVQLGTLQSAQSGTMRLVGDDSEAASKADFVLRAAEGDDRGSANLALLAGVDRSVLWSKDFAESGDRKVSVALKAATTAARVLDCALEGRGGNSTNLDQQTLKTYLGACAAMDEVGWDKRPVVADFRTVIAKAPKFKAAWARLLVAESDTVSYLRATQPGPVPLENALRRDIFAARKIDPALGEATFAETLLMPAVPYSAVLAKLDEAKAQSPNSAVILSERSQRLLSVGRVREGVEESREAWLTNSLSPEARSSYIIALAYSGQIAAARQELSKAFQLWPDAETLRQADFALELRFGDPRKAFAEHPEMDNAYGVKYRALREQPTDQNLDAFMKLMLTQVSYSGMGSSVVQALGEIGRTDELYSFTERQAAIAELKKSSYILFRPWLADARNDPRFIRLSNRIGLTDYWRQSGKWPDFCSDPALPYDCKAEAAKYG